MLHLEGQKGQNAGTFNKQCSFRNIQTLDRKVISLIVIKGLINRLIIQLFKDALQTVVAIQRWISGRYGCNTQYARRCRDSGVTQGRVSSQHYPTVWGKPRKKMHSGTLVSQQRFEPETFRVLLHRRLSTVPYKKHFRRYHILDVTHHSLNTATAPNPKQTAKIGYVRSYK